MKFLVDAHLPRRLALSIDVQGNDALHTLDLPNGNRTTDAEILTISEQEQRIVITKDADFVSSLLVSERPYKLLLISTGNITKQEPQGRIFAPDSTPHICLNGLQELCFRRLR